LNLRNGFRSRWRAAGNIALNSYTEFENGFLRQRYGRRGVPASQQNEMHKDFILGIGYHELLL
jgi:hypothetical protein